MDVEDNDNIGVRTEIPLSSEPAAVIEEVEPAKVYSEEEVAEAPKVNISYPKEQLLASWKEATEENTGEIIQNSHVIEEIINEMDKEKPPKKKSPKKKSPMKKTPKKEESNEGQDP